MIEMPKKTVDNNGEFVALVYEYDEKQYHKRVGEFWVVPSRVYRGGRGRAEIEFEHDGRKQLRSNHPGAGSFELYKRV